MKKIVCASMVLTASIVHGADMYSLSSFEFTPHNKQWGDGIKKAVPTFKRTFAFGISGEYLGIIYSGRFTRNVATVNDESSAISTGDIQTLYKDIDITNSLSVRIGKFVENWQIGDMITPLNVLDPYAKRTGFYNDHRNDMGLIGMTVTYTFDTATITGYKGYDDIDTDIVNGYGHRYVAWRYMMAVDDNTDITILGQKKNDGRWGAGAGVQHILNDSTKVYGSMFARRGTQLGIHNGVYTNNANYIAMQNPIGTYRKNSDTLFQQAMFGIQHTLENQLSLQMELGIDTRGMNTTQWQTYKQMVANHKALSGRAVIARLPNVLWDVSANNHQGMRDTYIFMRAEKKNDIYTVSSVLKMGVDVSGLLITEYKFTGMQKFLAGIRLTNAFGSADSEYGGYFPYRYKIMAYIRKDF